METKELGHRFYLSTEGYHFIYKRDYFDKKIIRAILLKEDSDKTIIIVDNLIMKNDIEMSHHKVIEYFEAKITLGLID